MKKSGRATTGGKAAKPWPLKFKLKLALIVAVFLAADAAACYYFFFEHSPAVPRASVAASGSVTTARPKYRAAAEIYRPQMEVFKYRAPSKNERFGSGFDYSHAVRGNIASIPLTQRARSGILVDMDNHKVLWAKNEKESVPIASMTKMMTCLLLFEHMERDRNLTLETPLPVTAAASRVGESSVYLQENEVFQIEDYLKAVIIKSANDAAYALGEYLGNGDVDNFIKLMNRRAAELNMPGADYHSPNGLPDSQKRESMGSAEGMALLAERIMEYPVYFKYSTAKGGKIRQTTYANTNKRLLEVDGVDGLKTGYTNKAGSCVTASCVRNNRRLVLVLTGMSSTADRTNCAIQLLDWGYKRK